MGGSQETEEGAWQGDSSSTLGSQLWGTQPSPSVDPTHPPPLAGPETEEKVVAGVLQACSWLPEIEPNPSMGSSPPKLGQRLRRGTWLWEF